MTQRRDADAGWVLDPPASAVSAPSLDSRDRSILAVLAEHPVAGVSAVAVRLGMARATVRARLTRMNDTLLAEHALRVPPNALGFSVRAFARVRVAAARLDAFISDLREIDEVVECLRITGDSDLRVELVLTDLASLDALQTRVRSCRGVERIATDVVVGELLPRRVSQLL